MAYEPTWLRGSEVYQRFGSTDAAKAWLARAVDDRGVICDGTANPSRHLFRLSEPIRWHASRRWRAASDKINWETFSIPAPLRRGSWPSVGIEVSRVLLQRLLRTSTPGFRPTRLEACRQEMCAMVMCGKLTVSDLSTMKQEALRATFNVARATAVKARHLALSDLQKEV